MSRTKIEWSEMSWNPVIGCTKVSVGCQNCYAEKMMYRQVCMGAARHEKNPDSSEDAWEAYSSVMDEDTHKWNGSVALRPEILDQPLHWRKPKMIFVVSMGDLFHEAVPFEFIWKVLETTQKCYAKFCGEGKCNHIFQFLTKRPKRMAQAIDKWLNDYGYDGIAPYTNNLWLGVSVENQKAADERIPILLQIPAAVRFVSVEPMLEDIYLPGPLLNHGFGYTFQQKPERIGWVIVGCESGPKRRPCKIEWMWDIIRHCGIAHIPVFVKQLSINGKVSHKPEEWPKWARLRQWPKEK